MKTGTIIIFGSICGLLAVAVGAFGAHGVDDPQAKAWITTGASYHMAHSLAIIAAAFIAHQGGQAARLAVWFYGAGILLFSGSLYGLGFGAPRSLAMAAPLGGLSFMIGWAMLAWAGLQLRRNEP